VLEEIGLPFSLSFVSTADGSTRTPEYLGLNPKGRVPVLITGDFVLTELPAILLHLAIAHPGGWPAAKRRRQPRQVNRMVQLVVRNSARHCNTPGLAARIVHVGSKPT